MSATTHYLTRWDGEGDPYGTVCDCDIDFDHNLDGSPTDPSALGDDEGERR